MIIETMKSYAHLLKAYQIENVLACATSAMRDATNGVEVQQEIKQKTGIDVR